MSKSIVITVLVSALTAACSGTSQPPQSASAGRETPPPADARPAPNGEAHQPNAVSPEGKPPVSPEPAAAPVPRFREITIPAGTSLTVTLGTALASDTSKVEDPIGGTLAKPIVVSGSTAIAKGAQLAGSVLEANGSGRVKGKASIVFQFDRIDVRGDRHEIHTGRIVREAAQNKKQDVKKGAVGAGAGAIVGGLVGGGTGAAVGAGVGGAGAVLATKGDEVRLEAGTTVSTTLRDAVTVQVPVE